VTALQLAALAYTLVACIVLAGINATYRDAGEVAPTGKAVVCAMLAPAVVFVGALLIACCYALAWAWEQVVCEPSARRGQA
jgi:hypothetical protein